MWAALPRGLRDPAGPKAVGQVTRRYCGKGAGGYAEGTDSIFSLNVIYIKSKFKLYSLYTGCLNAEM